MCDCNRIMYLVPAPVETGQDTPCKAYRTLVSMRRKEERNDMYYCFWGLLDFETISATQYDSKTDDEKKLWAKIDNGDYAKKETRFTVVPGYESVTFSEAKDKSLYHPGKAVPPYKDVTIEEEKDDDDTGSSPNSNITKKKRRVRTEQDMSETAQGKCIPTSEDSYIIFCSPEPMRYIFQTKTDEGNIDEDKYNYSFQLLEVPINSYVPWTYTNRMGVFRITYGKFGVNNYDMEVIKGGTPGIVWGIGEHKSFLRSFPYVESGGVN